jgi:hypothetical protein
MKTINELSRRTAELETNIQEDGKKVTVERRGCCELLRYGKLIVKCIRGISFSDL